MDSQNIPTSTSSQNSALLTENKLKSPEPFFKTETSQSNEVKLGLDKNLSENQQGLLNSKSSQDTLTSQTQTQNPSSLVSPFERSAKSSLNPTIVSGSILDKKTLTTGPTSINKNIDDSAEDSELKNLSRKRDRTMAEFVLMMDQYAPIIPDLCTDYYLTQAGFDCDDYRVKRVLALATQKFVSDIATDAYQYAKMRNQAPKDRKSGKGKKVTLTMDDLSPALSEYGINVKKPDYYL